MVISCPQKKYEKITLDGTQLVRASSYKYLGVKIDQNLNYSQHINTLAKTINLKIRTLCRLSHILPKGIIVLLYKSIIVPHLDYANIIWGSASANLLQHLQDIQTRAISKLTKNKNLSDRLINEDYGIQRLSQRRKLNLAILIYNTYISGLDSCLIVWKHNRVGCHGNCQ